MARSQNSFIKKQKAQKKRKKKEEKFKKKMEKKNQDTSGALEDMMAYVDEFGNILSEPPEDSDESEKKAENDNEK
jgi:uncharacterized protein YaaR (DUF327 family)